MIGTSPNSADIYRGYLDIEFPASPNTSGLKGSKMYQSDAVFRPTFQKRYTVTFHPYRSVRLDGTVDNWAGANIACEKVNRIGLCTGQMLPIMSVDRKCYNCTTCKGNCGVFLTAKSKYSSFALRSKVKTGYFGWSKWVIVTTVQYEKMDFVLWLDQLWLDGIGK